MNYIEKHFAEMIESEPFKAAAKQVEDEDFDTAVEFDRVISFVHENPHKFIKLIRMAEMILSVRDVLWRESEGNC
jgi:hypothetical protein